MSTNGTNLWLLRSKQGKKDCPCGKQNTVLMQSYSWMNTPGGMPGDHTAIHPLKDVCTHCWIQTEGSGEVDLPKSPVWSPKAGPQGRCTCCAAHRVPDLQRRNWGPLPSGIHAKEVAQTPTMWSWTSTGGNQGHFVFLEGLPMVEERWSVRRKWRIRSCQCSSILPFGQSPSPLCIVQLDHINGSPSRTQNQHLKKTKQLGSPLPTLIWGPYWSWARHWVLPAGASCHAERGWGVISHKSPQLESTKSGLHGGDIGSTHPTGGGS